ncbi:hypothetical protein WN55_09136 [Dufourea novaeangliae]|uniref:Uncharacterized protein n=1 Tax=Dufourea novaeangliae TaxID=178035 RepID=A0A154P898_DUFNO|nr:hypothetical protein WN55_09136 [Dufourea novaeangliae]
MTIKIEAGLEGVGRVCTDERRVGERQQSREEEQVDGNEKEKKNTVGKKGRVGGWRRPARERKKEISGEET